MGKRSNFERVERDCYDTPAEALAPLLPHLKPHTQFIEPCAGTRQLVISLERAGHICTWASDIEPRTAVGVFRADALSLKVKTQGQTCITNPPWTRGFLHQFIAYWAPQCPTWLLFDADWKHTRQASPFIPLLRKIVSVGRVKWIPGSPSTGKDNCAWYLFDANDSSPAIFVGRAPAPEREDRIAA